MYVVVLDTRDLFYKYWVLWRMEGCHTASGQSSSTVWSNPLLELLESLALLLLTHATEMFGTVWDKQIYAILHLLYHKSKSHGHVWLWTKPGARGGAFPFFPFLNTNIHCQGYLLHLASSGGTDSPRSTARNIFLTATSKCESSDKPCIVRLIDNEQFPFLAQWDRQCDPSFGEHRYASQ